MSLKRYAARRDATEKPIVQALRQLGAKVIHLDKFDLLVLYKGRLFMFDAKVPKKGRKTISQEKLRGDGWPLTYVESIEGALTALGIGATK